MAGAPRNINGLAEGLELQRMAIETLLVLQQVSDHIHVPVRTLRRWHTQGIGPKMFRVGPHRLMVKESDLASWLEAQYEGAGGHDAAA